MLFILCEHYDNYSVNNVKNNEYSEEECFICYDVKTLEEMKPNKLNNQSIYTKICNCNVNVHYTCLEKWVILNKNCPICRTKVVLPHYIYSYNNIFYISDRRLFIVFSIIKKTIFILVRYILIYSMIYNILILNKIL